VPVALRSTFSLRGRLIERVRDGLVIWTRFLDPWVRFTMSRADLVIARTRITQDALGHMCSGKCEVMLETGISQELLDERGPEGAGKNRDPVVLMVGRFLHWKGMDLGIEAFLRLSARFPHARLLILGVGPEGQRLKERAEPANGCIEFLGQRPREEVLELMRSSSALLVPSMKDGGTWVIYEAMACRLPVVCVDYAGPAELVGEGCGIKIPVASPEEVVAGLASGLERLLADPAAGKEIAERAKADLAVRYLWDRLGERMAGYYARIVGGQGDEEAV
jgi:glycosyltransferase involved in cell wall biosynthesis